MPTADQQLRRLMLALDQPLAVLPEALDNWAITAPLSFVKSPELWQRQTLLSREALKRGMIDQIVTLESVVEQTKTRYAVQSA